MAFYQFFLLFLQTSRSELNLVDNPVRVYLKARISLLKSSSMRSSSLLTLTLTLDVSMATDSLKFN